MNKTMMLALCCNIINVINTSSLFPTHLFVKRVGPCHKMPHNVMVVSEFSISRARYNFTLYGVINVTEDIPNEWQIKATMQKCQDIRNLDTCDFLKSFTLISSGCSEVASQDRDYYDTLFASAYPRMECPVKAGSYKIRGYPYMSKGNLLLVSESKITTSMFGYTYRIEGFNAEDEKIFCVDAVLRVIYLRDPALIDKVNEKKMKKEGDDEEGDSATENYQLHEANQDNDDIAEIAAQSDSNNY